MRLAAPSPLAVIAGRKTETNACLAAAGGSVLSPAEAASTLRHGEVALARLDVRRTLDGIEPGLELLDELECRGVLVLNESRTLIASHDKLLTARALTAAGVLHPATYHVHSSLPSGLATPFVLKPRFGSWGRDVVLCKIVRRLRPPSHNCKREGGSGSTGRLRRHSFLHLGGTSVSSSPADGSSVRCNGLRR